MRQKKQDNLWEKMTKMVIASMKQTDKMLGRKENKCTKGKQGDKPRERKNETKRKDPTKRNSRTSEKTKNSGKQRNRTKDGKTRD